MSCYNCKHCEAHGYPPEGAPEWYCSTVFQVCSMTNEFVEPFGTCDKYEKGKPKVVRDDADW